jgi:hypothetical protein
MRNNLFSSLTCLLLLLFGHAIANARQSTDVMTLTVPAAPWNLTLPQDGLVMNRQQLKPDGRHGYFLLDDHKNLMTVSLLSSPRRSARAARNAETWF